MRVVEEGEEAPRRAGKHEPAKPHAKHQPDPVPSRPARTPPPPAPAPLSLERRKARKLSSGRIEIEGRIDLHGMRQSEAHSALVRFLHRAYADGRRWVLVITGKGARTDNDYIAAMTERGILRTMLPIWLSEPGLAHLISGWSVAARGHGGEGAWYVRLRRQ